MRAIALASVALATALVAGCSVPGKAFVDEPLPSGPDDAGMPPEDASAPLPDTTITLAPPGADNSTTVMFEFSSDQSDATFECSVDAAAYAACKSPATLTNLLDGAHLFKVRAIDKASRPDATPADYSWTIDTSTPDTQITNSPSGKVNSTTAQLEFSSPNAGAGATFECRIDAEAFAACTSPKTYTDLTEGKHTFEAQVKNAVGTQDPTPATRTWTIDVTPPNTMVVSGPPATNQLGLTSFDFSTNEAGATFECSLDNAAFAACSDPLQQWIGNGAHTLKVRARDPSGNPDPTPATYSWTAALANIAFVLRAGSTNLGGLAGADAKCMAAAQAAGMQGTYKAWLSTSAVNAIDRLGGARGWIRRDAKPFADTLATLVAGKVYFPLTLEATGGFVNDFVVTGTLQDGKFAGAAGSCADWTTAGSSATAGYGESTRTSGAWSSEPGGSASCNEVSGAIYCFGTDFTTQVAPPPPPAGARIAFVTKDKWSPAGGLTFADAICQNDATVAGLTGTFKAALATKSAGALARFSSTGAPWMRVDGVPITTTTAAMFDPALAFFETAISVTAAGAYVTEGFGGDAAAWSGPRLVAATDTCLDWTTSSGSMFGSSGLSSITKTSLAFGASLPFCSNSFRLYCLQQ